MELIPCPFCGSNEIGISKELPHHPYIECQCCYVEVGYSDDIESAKKLWNTRHSPWISVKDRLPKKNGRYLVIEDHHSNWTGICKFSNGKFELKVTHWMPLPSLPEEKCE